MLLKITVRMIIFKAWEPGVNQCRETAFSVYDGDPHGCMFLFVKRLQF